MLGLEQVTNLTINIAILHEANRQEMGPLADIGVLLLGVPFRTGRGGFTLSNFQAS
jgi:hypothetical protein